MVQKQPGSEEQRRAAAAAALGEIRSGMKLGLGTGRTAGAFVELLGQKVRDGLSVVGVPTSEVTAKTARSLGIPLTTLDETPELDVTVDGADEVDPAFRLIKGGGGALLREKIVASASKRMIVVVDDVKCVDTLGRFPLPIEVVPFGYGATRLEIENAASALGLSGTYDLRQEGGETFVTDGGHHIIDASFGHIPDPDSLAHALSAIPGVVEHGLFIGLASRVIVGRDGGITELEATSSKS